ncbi:MAG: hypothetical protein L0271_15805, partial [Gemmatimonadetes bacterium]|nr:hypothetical protein [Gemmatimonadota bacterium]
MSWKRVLGLDNLSEQYAYTDDPVLGHTSASRAADRWVKTTCGYCSVGCGMEIGVRDGKAVAVRGERGRGTRRSAPRRHQLPPARPGRRVRFGLGLLLR